MKKIKVRMKANELSDANVEFISLVERPANRIPFKVLKSEETGEKKMTINLSSLFRKEKAEETAPRILAAMVRKEDRERLEPKLKEFGLNLDKVEEKDGVLVFKQVETDVEAAPVKINDDIIVLVEAKKYFDSAPYGSTLTEQVDAQLFYPGVCMATQVLGALVDRVLYDSRSAEEFRLKLKEVVGQYSKYIMSLADALPEAVFKMEADFKKNVGKDLQTEIKKSETTETKVEGEIMSTEKKDEVKKEETPTEVKETPVEKVDGDVCEMPDGSKGTWKGGKCVAAAKKEDESVKQTDFMASLAEMQKTLQAGMDAVATQVTKSVDDLKGRIEAVEKIAKSADEAVRGTVVRKGESEVPNEALGTMRSKSDTKGDLWSGSALDRIG